MFLVLLGSPRWLGLHGGDFLTFVPKVPNEWKLDFRLRLKKVYHFPLQNIQCYDYVLNYSYYDHTNNLVWNGQALPIMLGMVPSDHAWMS